MILLALYLVSAFLLIFTGQITPIGVVTMGLTIALTVVVLLSYGLAYFLHTLFPYDSNRGRCLKWTFITFGCLIAIACGLQTTAPHVIWDSRSTGGVLVRMDSQSLELVEGFVEPTEHDRCFHGWTQAYRRIELPPIRPFAILALLLLIPTFVESLNCRFKWRTPIKDLPRIRRERRRLRDNLCHKCEYDMRGSSSTICPECGADRSAIDFPFDPADIRGKHETASGRPRVDA